MEEIPGEKDAVRGALASSYFSRERLRRVLRKKTSAELRLIYIFTSSPLHIYMFTSRSWGRCRQSTMKRNPLRRSCVSRARNAGEIAFWTWRLGAALLEEVSYEALALETWRCTFGGSLVRSARFGVLALHFWRKSRTKRSSSEHSPSANQARMKRSKPRAHVVRE